MTISKRGTLIIAGVLVLIAIILLLIFWPRAGGKPIFHAPAKTNQQAVNTAPATPVVKPTVTPAQKTEASVATISQTFTERFGSYSTESEAANLQDVLPLVTASFRAKLETQIAHLLSTPAKDYYGVTTRVLSTNIKSVNETSATVDVLTQREEATGSAGNTSVKYQTVTLQLNQVGGVWLVDSATWQ